MQPAQAEQKDLHLDQQLMFLVTHHHFLGLIKKANVQVLEFAIECFKDYSKNPQGTEWRDTKIVVPAPKELIDQSSTVSVSCENVLRKYLPQDHEIQSSSWDFAEVNLEEAYLKARHHLVNSSQALRFERVELAISRNASINYSLTPNPTHSFKFSTSLVDLLKFSSPKIEVANVPPLSEQELNIYRERRNEHYQMICEKILRTLSRYSSAQANGFGESDFQFFSQNATDLCHSYFLAPNAEWIRSISGLEIPEPKIMIEKLKTLRNLVFPAVFREQIEKVFTLNQKEYSDTVAGAPSVLLMESPRPSPKDWISILEKKKSFTQESSLLTSQDEELAETINSKPYSALQNLTFQQKQKLRDALVIYLATPFHGAEVVQLAMRAYMRSHFSGFNSKIQSEVERILADIATDQDFWNRWKAVGINLALAAPMLLCMVPVGRLGMTTASALARAAGIRAGLCGSMMVSLTGLALIQTHVQLDRVMKSILKAESAEFRQSLFEDYSAAESSAVFTLLCLAVFSFPSLKEVTILLKNKSLRSSP